MPNIDSKELIEKFDIVLWQKVQNKFAELIDLPIFTMDEEGNELITSTRFPRFCQIVKSLPRGHEKCRECRKRNYVEMCQNGQTIKFYTCHANLLNIMVPVVIGTKAIGAVVCSSIIQQIRDVSACRELSELLGIERRELEEMLVSIKQKSKAEVERYGTLLYVLSQTVPELIHAKKITEEKMNELALVQGLGEKMNSTLDIDDTLSIIADFLNGYVGAGKSSVAVFGDKEIKRSSSIFGEGKEASLFAWLKQNKKPLTTEDEEGSVILIPLKIQEEVIGSINIAGKNLDISDKKLQLLSIIAEQAAMAIMNSMQYDKIKQLAVTDKLTGLYNRRYFMEALEKEIVRSKRFFNPLSLILMDIDHFGKYNNRMGHPKGDSLLKRISQLFQAYARSVDIIGRYGGEEFIVILPQCNEEHALIIAERLRNAVANEKFEGGEGQPGGAVTVSVGCVTSRDFSLKSEEIVKMADKALYEAKNNGRNKVVHQVLRDDAIESLNKAKDEGIVKG